MGDGGHYKANRNHLMQLTHGKLLLNNSTDIGEIEMQKRGDF